MNKQRAIEVINAALSGFAFSDKHRHDLMTLLKREKHAGMRNLICLIAVFSVLLAVVILVLALIRNKP
jgi:hypothetical protein